MQNDFYKMCTVFFVTLTHCYLPESVGQNILCNKFIIILRNRFLLNCFRLIIIFLSLEFFFLVSENGLFFCYFYTAAFFIIQKRLVFSLVFFSAALLYRRAQITKKFLYK